jgi:hypothetical protein
LSGPEFEWWTSNSHIEYPFDARQPDGLHELFVDAYLLHYAQADVRQRVRLASFDPSGEAELRFEDGTLLASLGVSDDFTARDVGLYRVYEWQVHTTDGAGFTLEDLVFRLVAVISRLADFTYPVTPAAAYFLPVLAEGAIRRVRRLAVALPTLPCCVGGGIGDKPVAFEPGNNMQLTLAARTPQPGIQLAAAEEVRAPTTITFAAVAGAGTGLFPTCGSLSNDIRKIGGVGADARGNFSLQGADCTWHEVRETGAALPPIHPNTDYYISMLDATLQLHESCHACCRCEDYGNAYKQLKRWWERGLTVAARFEALRLEYNQVCQDTKNLKIARETGLSVRTRALSRPDYHLAVSAIVMNNSEAQMGSITLKFELDKTGAVYTASSGHVEAENMHNQQLDPVVGGGGTSYTVVLPSLRPAHYAIYSFSVRFNTGSRHGAVVRVKASATRGATTVSDQKTVALRDPLEKT